MSEITQIPYEVFNTETKKVVKTKPLTARNASSLAVRLSTNDGIRNKYMARQIKEDRKNEV
jgi:hypothetical protein